SYSLGAWILGTPMHSVGYDFSWEWITTELTRVWKPFLLGSFLVGAISALLGYLGIRGLWRWHVVRDWEKRKKVRDRTTPT
ncbi:MAG: DUF2062 domain-containing protein, partial [Gammaproteobacteria bacterium]|nr:DUF2062 domain-containing protein [Gammaproteobacteria bacterium]